MTELDKYRPPDYNNPTGPWSRWAFRTTPQWEHNSDGSWTVRPPGDDPVTAPTKEDAATRMRERSLARPDHYAHDEAICARHLKDPIPGIYAMDIGVFNELRETESDDNINRAFEDAEAFRREGRVYTKADYFARSNECG